MLNQVQTIRAFAEREFGNSPHAIAIDRDGTNNEIANGDRASAVLAANGKRCRIVLTSAYIEPPLGRIVMTDLATQHVIAGNKSDALWGEIAAHIRSSTATPAGVVAQAAIPQLLPEKPVDTSPDGRVPYLSQPVLFIAERGEPVGGMTELAAMVTRISSPTVVSVTVFPQTGELFWRNDLARRSAKRQFNCWDFSEAAPITERELTVALDELTKPKRGKVA